MKTMSKPKPNLGQYYRLSNDKLVDLPRGRYDMRFDNLEFAVAEVKEDHPFPWKVRGTDDVVDANGAFVLCITVSNMSSMSQHLGRVALVMLVQALNTAEVEANDAH